MCLHRDASSGTAWKHAAAAAAADAEYVLKKTENRILLSVSGISGLGPSWSLHLNMLPETAI